MFAYQVSSGSGDSWKATNIWIEQIGSRDENQTNWKVNSDFPDISEQSVQIDLIPRNTQ